MTSAEGTPAAIKVFETLSIILIAAGVVSSERFSIMDIVWVAFYLWMILSITRRKSTIARMIFTGLFGIGVIPTIILVWMYPEVFSSIDIAKALVGLATWGASAFQFRLVWTPSASRWLARK